MQKRYLRIMVSDRFEGLGGAWCPIYIPCYVEDGKMPNFPIEAVDRKLTLLTEEEFQIAQNHDFSRKYGG